MSAFISLAASVAAILNTSASFVATDVIRAGEQVSPTNITTEAGEAAPADPFFMKFLMIDP